MKTLLVLVVVTAAVLAAAVLNQREPPAIARSGTLLFPGLLSRVNEATEIVVTSAGKNVTLKAGANGWTVTERDGYPAEDDEVRELLLGAAAVKRIEPKTRKPELYAQIELEPPEGEGAKSIGYRVTGPGGAPIAALVVGKRRLLTRSVDADQYFVRVPGEPQAWLVEGKLPKNQAVTDWLAREVLEVDVERVHRVTVRHPDGEVVRVAKTAPSTAFTLLGIPEGREVAIDYDVHSIASTPADLTLTDVVRRSEVSFEAPNTRVVLETFDGLRVGIDVGRRGEEEWLRLEAAYDPSLARLFESVRAGDPKAEKLKSPEAVRTESETLAARWSGWAYQVPRFNLDTVRKRVEDLLAKLPEASGGAPSGNAPAGRTEPGTGAG